MVAHNPGAWFDEVLRSVVAQDYPALDVVVIDSASDRSVAPRVHDIVPEAIVQPLAANHGFAKAANTILEHRAVGPYVLVMHDDVALAPDCVRRLVEETLRSNAGVTGPKLLDWNDPKRILHVGLGADKTGLVSDLAEPGEYDQEQHDAVRDVFAVPGAVTLIRTDLFRALGGFDDVMSVRGEDLDLCWRAHALGARVIVNPAATARHREDLTTRIPGADDDRLSRRHRIRAMLSNYGVFHTLRVVPQAMVASFVNIILALLQGRVGLIVEILGAWTWNFVRLPSVLRRRRQLAKVRQVDDAEVRALQLPGFEGINTWRRARADRREPAVGDDAAPPAQSQAERSRNMQMTGLVWAGVVGVLLFGSRELITDGVPQFNQFVEFPSGPSSLLTEWGSTWRSTGVGSEAPSSPLHVLLGFASVALFGQIGLVRLIAIVGLLFVGVVGAYRLMAPFAAMQSQIVALLVYAAAPLPYNALYEGSWSGLVAYAAMPWIVRRMAMAAAIAPFSDDEPTMARRASDVVALSLILAAAAMIEPWVALTPALLAGSWSIGSLATRRVNGALSAIVVAVASMVGAFLLSMPASLGLVSSDFAWSSLAGAERVAGHELGMSRLLRLATGPHGDSLFGWVLLVVPALALVMASGRRLAWAARSWVGVVVSVGLVVASESGRIDVSLPPAVVLLAPAGIGLAMAAGLTAVAFGSDLRRHRFGWRQAVPIIAIVALVVSSLVGLGGSLDGRWKVVDDGYDDVFAFFDERAPAHARTFWIGDASVLPVNGWAYDDQLSYAITQARTPTILDFVPGNPSPQVLDIRDRFEQSLNGAGNRLGRVLAREGIRYVVVVEANAPAPFSSVIRPVPVTLADRLTEQLDLVRIEVRAGATVYENRAYVPTVSSHAPGSLLNGDTAFTNFDLALAEVTSMRTYRGPLDTTDLYVAVPAGTNWELTAAGRQIAPAAYDWATLFSSESPGDAELRHANVASYWLASVAQILAWLGLVALLILARRRTS